MRLLILFFFTTTIALHCDKDFTYYNSYGNGFNVTCQGITNEHINILQNISITQEISLTIENSTLTNASPELFQQMSQLKNLFIYNSIFTFSYHQQVFKYLKSLENLEIKNTHFNVTKNTFIGLDHLKNLIMSNNSLSKMEEGSFKHLPSLRKIEITLNKINNMGDLPLCEIKDLDALNMSRNSITSLKLPNFHCKSSQAQSFEINLNNHAHSLNVPKYENVSEYGLTLTHIDLSNNKLSEIGDTVSNLKLIRSLRLQSNTLKRLRSFELANLKDLEEIYLENNKLELIEEKLFDGKPNLQYIDISHNKLLAVTINEVPKLTYLNLAHNQLSGLRINGITTRKSIQILILNNNKFNVFGPDTFKDYSSLEELDLAYNRVILTEQSLNGLLKLKTLILKNNSIEEISSHVFESLTQLKTLDLSCNKIKAITYIKTFQYLNNLEILNISYNIFDVLPHDIFEPLTNLKVLDISGNKLKELQHELILPHLKFLSVLDLKSNLLSCEILQKVIHDLKAKNVTYTLEMNFDYERENVGGIYCTSEPSALSIVSKDSNNSSGSALVTTSIILSVMFILVILGVVLFRTYVYMKRRKYRPDEFELIN